MAPGEVKANAPRLRANQAGSACKSGGYETPVESTRTRHGSLEVRSETSQTAKESFQTSGSNESSSICRCRNFERTGAVKMACFGRGRRGGGAGIQGAGR